MNIIHGLFVNSNRSDDRVFFELIKSSIDINDLEKFSCEFGFAGPNNFPFSKIMEILRGGKFPESELVDYGWAIYESGLERISEYDKFTQLFLSSLFLYSHKLTGAAANVDNAFYFNLLRIAVDNGDVELLKLIALFIEWLYKFTSSYRGHDDFYMLLTWSIVKLLLDADGNGEVGSVINSLINKKYTFEDIELLADTNYPKTDDWFDFIDMHVSSESPFKKALCRVLLGGE